MDKERLISMYRYEIGKMEEDLKIVKSAVVHKFIIREIEIYKNQLNEMLERDKK